MLWQVCIDGLCANQVETEIEVRGPPVSKAFDDQGNPTKVPHNHIVYILVAILSILDLHKVYRIVADFGSLVIKQKVDVMKRGNSSSKYKCEFSLRTT